MNADKTLTLNLTLFLTILTRCVVRILTKWVSDKRLVREAAGSNLNSRCFVDGRVSIK